MAKKTTPGTSSKKKNSSEKSRESAADILKRELPHLINDVAMLVRRPFRFIWDQSIETASTDCLAEIRVAPRPFIEGEREVGYGTVYHETGHIRFSPYGVDLLRRGHKIGGEVLQSLINIIIDRKDDVLTARDAPGFADTLRRRLLVIRTMGRRKRYEKILKRFTLKQQSQILRNFKPSDVYEDFFLAAKCGKSPRFKATKKAMHYVRLKELLDASPEKLLWIAQRVWEILGSSIKEESKPKQKSGDNLDQENTKGNGTQNLSSSNPKKSKKREIESQFVQLCIEAEKSVYGEKLSTELKFTIEAVVKQYLGAARVNGTSEILRRLASMEMVYPGPISVGLVGTVPVEEVRPDPRHALEYQKIKGEVQNLITPMIRTLRNLSTPSEFDLYGQDEGELDFNEVARIATGLSGYRMETITERDIDAEIHFAIDCSGSMDGFKIEEAKKLGVVFSEAIDTMKPNCIGRVWSFNARQICDYGETDPCSGFVQLQGSWGNSDSHMLQIVGKKLLKSVKRRKILFVLCDDGPDDMELVRKLTQQLTARGVIVIHLLVGVHGSPDIYPIELLYSSIEECLEEFGDLLKTIISHLK